MLGKLEPQDSLVFQQRLHLKPDDVFLPPGGERNRGLFEHAMPAVAHLKLDRKAGRSPDFLEAPAAGFGDVVIIGESLVQPRISCTTLP